MVYSLIALRVVERIPAIKDYLIKPLIFRSDFEFLHSDEAFYSRRITVISKSGAMAYVNYQVIFLAIDEEHIGEENIVVDATHFEARDRLQASEKKEKPKLKKRGRKLGKMALAVLGCTPFPSNLAGKQPEDILLIFRQVDE